MYRILSRSAGPLLGAAAAGLIVFSATALAGSGVGGVFNLGQVNTVDAQTTLTANIGNPALKVVNGGAAAALRGEAQTGIGVNGVSVSGTGQQGQSQTGIGLLGVHSATTGVNPGVQGQTASTDPLGAGILGKNTGGGPALRAIVNAGAPPLAVNSPVKVLNLNADLLDGVDSAALQNRVTGTCGAGLAIRVVNANGTVSCEPVGAGGTWGLSGNADTTPGTNFLGTTDNHALELKVNGARALRLEPDATSPNLIGGFSGNAVQDGAVGASIAGGGDSTIGPNIVTDDFGTVAGGQNNVVGDADGLPGFAIFATVGGGRSNIASDSAATVSGGTFNTAGGDDSTVGGGSGNTAGADNSTVAGGVGNNAGGPYATVAGGFQNSANGAYSFTAGRRAVAQHQGTFVWADSGSSPVVSTTDDQVTMRASGGVRLFSSPDTTSADAPGLQLLPGISGLAPAGDNQPLELKVGGIRALRLEPGTTPNFVGGSSGNSVTSGVVGATISGGGDGSNFLPNRVTGNYGTVGGGRGNTASDFQATVGGGSSNNATGSSSTVGGGTDNHATAQSAAVGGGTNNTAGGNFSTVPGGLDNAASGVLSFAAGKRAKANHQGAFVWADTTNADFASTGPDQFLVRANGGAKIVRGTSSFHSTGAALQVEHAGTEGEAGWLRIVSSTSVAPVLNLLKHPSGTGNFLTCTDFDGTSTSAKCHIDSAGTFVAGSDFAESLPARGGKAGYEPGDVLVASVSHPGEVERSHRRFDRAVLGVYSTRPGVLGADKGGITRVGKDDIPVAVTGIVPVKVSTENGPIRPGDLLTSSSLPGHAMRAGAHAPPGSVLGKALASLASGKGRIRVLVLPAGGAARDQALAGRVRSLERENTSLLVRLARVERALAALSPSHAQKEGKR